MKAYFSRHLGLLVVSGVFFSLIGTGTSAGGNSAKQVDQAPMTARDALHLQDLRLSVWQWESGGELTLYANGEARHTEWLRNGTWQILDSGTMVLTHPNGLNFFVTFSDEQNAMIISAKGGRTTITLKEWPRSSD